MTYSLSWLPEVLEAAGLKVAQTPDWRTRGRGEMGPVRGVICHHTATVSGGNMPSLDLLIKGRPDLAGPLCHLGLGRDGTYYVVAAGRANHAGAGVWENIATGNANFIGIEAENSGRDGDEWPEVQLDAYRRGVAAILKHVGAGANMCCGHKEYAPSRKCDPNFDMPSFRSAVAELLVGKSPPPPIPARDDKDRLTLRRGARSDDVAKLQKHLGLKPDGVFGAQTEASVRVWQRAHHLVPDGIFGPRSWDLLDAHPEAETLAGLKPPPAAAPDPKTDHAVIDEIDLPLLRMAFPENTAAGLQPWLEPIKAACRRFGIDTKREICSFLANIDVESAGLTRLSENLNYSVDALLKLFSRSRISLADAQRLGRKPGEPPLSAKRQEELANILYGGAFGKKQLGNTDGGDGWRFRGYGPKQLTGRDNCQRLATSLGMPIDQIPDYLRTREGGCMSAGWFWKSKDLDRFAATPGLEDDRRAINGGTFGIEVVQKRFDVLIAELDRRAKT